jgi:hypothetical protein
MFSFVPAKAASDAIACFDRPIIREFVNPEYRRGARHCLPKTADSRAVREAWVRIANSVLDAGLVLGTELRIP